MRTKYRLGDIVRYAWAEVEVVDVRQWGVHPFSGQPLDQEPTYVLWGIQLGVTFTDVRQGDLDRWNPLWYSPEAVQKRIWARIQRKLDTGPRQSPRRVPEQGEPLSLYTLAYLSRTAKLNIDQPTSFSTMFSVEIACD